MKDEIIKVQDVSMSFRLDVKRTTSLKEWMINRAKRQYKYTVFNALDHVSFSIARGDVVGIVGNNGAGKSTLLKVISGIYKPTQGTAVAAGVIAPMLELGSGFDSELSGRENIFLNGAILGLTESLLKKKYHEIVEFSELGDFINAPIKTYSSGMMMRLAFSVATLVQPDILIVDEILSVGDANFRKKSKDKMMELMHSGATVLFVSHTLSQIRELCGKVIWLEHGKVKMFDDVQTVCDAYESSCQGG